MTPSKKCPNCQTDNELTAKFCFQCGSDLPEKGNKGTYCRECGFENPHNAKYCGKCGIKLSSGEKSANEHHKPTATPKSSKPSRKKRKKQKTSAEHVRHTVRRGTLQGWNYKVIGMIALGVVLFGVYAVYMNEKSLKISERYVENVSTNPALEAQMREVASKFVCACGSCPSEPLESCSCATARKERDFIRNALAGGQNADDVVKVLNNQYGGLKSTQLSLDKNDLNLNLPTALTANTPANEVNMPNGDALAGIANRQQIIEQFSCPCGQCAIDELKDCSCDHPRGAVEVKQFIDEQIATGNYTVAQVIDNVEQKYGGRIR